MCRQKEVNKNEGEGMIILGTKTIIIIIYNDPWKSRIQYYNLKNGILDLILKNKHVTTICYITKYW